MGLSKFSGLAAVALVVVAAAIIGAALLYSYQGYQTWRVERAGVINILNTNLQNGRLLLPQPPAPEPVAAEKK
jgi:hypothetical protein